MLNKHHKSGNPDERCHRKHGKGFEMLPGAQERADNAHLSQPKALHTLSPRLQDACIAVLRLAAQAGTHTAIELGQLLANMPCNAKDLAQHVNYRKDCYCRTTIAKSEEAELILIGWFPGQFSPPHDHGGEATNRCAVRVISGTGEERSYELNSDGELVSAGVDPVGQGDIVLNDGPDIHELGCCESATEPLVTLHLYVPPLTLEAMQIFECSETTAAHDAS